MPRQAKICCWRDHIFGSDDQWCTSINHLETRDWMILGLDQRWLYWYHWLMVMVMGHWLVMVPVSHGAWLSWNALINWSCFHVFPDQNAYHHLAEPEDHQNYACSRKPWFPRLHSMDRHGSNQCQAIPVTNQTKIRPYHHGKFRHHICPDPKYSICCIFLCQT